MLGTEADDAAIGKFNWMYVNKSSTLHGLAPGPTDSWPVPRTIEPSPLDQ